MILGFVGWWLYEDYSTINDRDAFQTWEGINLFKTKSFVLDSINFNFIMREPQLPAIHIPYSASFIQNDSAFIAILIPYNGNLDSYDIQNGWIAEPFSNSTLIYKQFHCKSDSTGNCRFFEPTKGMDDGNLLFTIDQQIDSKQFYTHSLNIPAHSPIDSNILGFVQFNVSKTGAAYWDANWTNATNNKNLSISVQDDATQINLIPPAIPRSLFVEQLKVNRTIYEWDMPNENTVFHIDYVMPQELEHFDRYRMISSILIAIGVSLVSVFIGNLFLTKR